MPVAVIFTEREIGHIASTLRGVCPGLASLELARATQPELIPDSQFADLVVREGTWPGTIRDFCANNNLIAGWVET
jgi:hypothetical protein